MPEIDGPAFITPHAVRQFMARIDRRTDYDQALTAILRGLRDHAREPRPSANGKSVYVRVRGPHNFRAVVVQEPGGDLPTVVTILKSGK